MQYLNYWCLCRHDFLSHAYALALSLPDSIQGLTQDLKRGGDIVATPTFGGPPLYKPNGDKSWTVYWIHGSYDTINHCLTVIYSSELEILFSEGIRAHYVIVPNNNTTILKTWSDLLLSSGNLDIELETTFVLHRPNQSQICSWTQDADLISSLTSGNSCIIILAVLPIGSTEAEWYFSCLRQVHSWLRTTMTEERDGNLGIVYLCNPIDIMAVTNLCRHTD